MFILQLLSLRIRRILTLTFCAFGAITLYLYHLQISHAPFFARLSKRNFLRTEKIESPRGNITDKHGTLLATNRPIYSLYWNGSGNRELSPTQQAQFKKIASLCSLDQELLPSIASTEKRSQELEIAHDISYATLLKLEEQVPNRTHIQIKKTYERYYPHNDLACHIVGYLGIKDTVSGKMGLEHIYDDKLQGQAGQILNIINSIGHRVQAHTLSSASAGKTVNTTLDISLQKIAEELFPKEYTGCFLLMDDEGALEVVLSRPSFNPCIFLKPITYTQWELLQKNHGFINRAFSGCYPPASLFKLVTLAAALETGVITPQTTWDCKGHLDFKGRRYHCNRRWGHKTVSTEKAFAFSCNIPFYEIGTTIPIDTLAYYARDFCLGYKTGVLFPEKAGLVPTTHWKRRVRREPWWPGETLSAVIGQSSLLVTPLQIACMITAVCTGYRVRPRLMVDEPIDQEPVTTSQDTLLFLQHCLSSVIKHGTGTSLKELHGFDIKGKSGTAQVRSLSNQALIKEHYPHGYFAAHIQYKDEKPRTLVILLEHAGSSRHAVKFAQEFLVRYAQLIDPQARLQPQRTPEKAPQPAPQKKSSFWWPWRKRRS